MTTTLAEFSQLFLELSRNESTGTLVVHRDGGEKVSLLFQHGGLTDIDAGEEHSVLTRSLLESGLVEKRELRKAQKRAQKSGQSAAHLLLEHLQTEDSCFLEKIEELFTDKVCQVFGDDIASAEFFEHETEERLEGFNSELSDVFDLSFDGQDLFVEALRRRDAWDIVVENLAELQDVFYATPKGMRYYSDADTFAREVEVIGNVDGYLDQIETIEKVDQPRFETLQILRSLARFGEIEPINPVQMFQLGVETYDKGDHAKARKLFRRSIERGLDDFDVQFKLADCNASLGLDDEAIALFKEFAQKCHQQFRYQGAIHSLRRVLELSPEDDDARKTLLDLFVDNNLHEDAVREAISHASRRGDAGDHRAGLDQLLYLKDRGCSTPELSRWVIDLAEKCGDQQVLEKEIASDPSRLDQLFEPEKALETYERIFAEGNESVEIRLKLVQLHSQLGHHDKSLAHINSILGTRHESEIKDTDTLAELHRTRLGLVPSHPISSRWLVDFHLKQGQVKEAMAVLHSHIEKLEEEENHFVTVEARKRLIALDRDNCEHRWELARLYQKLGRMQNALDEIENIALLASKHGDPKTTREAWNEILKVAPFHRSGLAGLAKSLKVAGDRKGAIERFKATAELDILTGNLEGASECAAEVRELDDSDPEIAGKLALAHLELGERKKGLKLLVEAATLYIEGRNFGLARTAIERAFCEAPGQENVLKLRKKLDEAEGALSRPPAPAAAESRTESAASQKAAQAAPVATPKAAAPQNEPFQGRSAVTKGTVTAITARLRSMKGGDSKKATSGGKIIVGGLKKITGSLKNVKAGAKARATAGGKASPDDESTKVIPGTSGAAKPVKGAASRLRALARSGEKSDADDAKVGATEAATGDSGSPPASDGGGDAKAIEEAVKASTDGGVQVKKSMGGAAARLAKLKAMKAKAQKPPAAGEKPPDEEAEKSDGPAAPEQAAPEQATEEPAAGDGMAAGGTAAGAESEAGADDTGATAALQEAVRAATAGDVQVTKSSMGGSAARLAKLKAARKSAKAEKAEETPVATAVEAESATEEA